MKTRITTALGVAALSIAALAGCSGGGQSVEEACAVLNADGQALGDEINELGQGASLENLPDIGAEMVTILNEASKNVTNQEVKQAWGDTVKLMDDTFKEIGKGNIEALMTMEADMTAATEKLEALCPDLGAVSPF